MNEMPDKPYSDSARDIAKRHQRGDDHVAAAAIMLKSLYDDYRSNPHAIHPWERFAEENFPWSLRWTYKLIEFGRQPDPAKALRKWREENAQRTRRYRDRKNDAKPEVKKTEHGTAEHVWRQYYSLNEVQKQRFDRWWEQARQEEFCEEAA